MVALGLRGPARRGGEDGRGRSGGRADGPSRTGPRPDGGVLRRARRVDASDEAPDGTDRRPRSGSARSADRDVRGRRVVRGPTGARSPDGPADLRRGEHLTSSSAGGPERAATEDAQSETRLAVAWDDGWKASRVDRRRLLLRSLGRVRVTDGGKAQIAGAFRSAALLAARRP